MSENETMGSNAPIIQTDRYARLISGFWGLIQIGILFHGILVVGYLLARCLVGERWNLVAFTNNFVPWIAATAFLLAGIALFSRHRWLLIILQLPIIAACLVWYGELFLPNGNTSKQVDGIELTVATYNTFG